MKFKLILFLSILSSSVLQAQPFIKSLPVEIYCVDPYLPRIADYNFHPATGGIVAGDNYSWGSGAINDFLIRFDNQGNILWSKYNIAIEGDFWGKVLQVSSLSNGNYLLTALGDTSAATFMYAYKVVRLDSNGNVISTRAWLFPNYSGVYNTNMATVVQDTGYSLFFQDDYLSPAGDTDIVYNHWMSFTNNDVLLFDSVHTLYYLPSGTPGTMDSLLYDFSGKEVLRLADKSFLFNHYNRVQKCSETGSIAWTKKIDSLLGITFYSFPTFEMNLYPTADSGVCGFVYKDVAGSPVPILFKLDKNGLLTDSTSLVALGYQTLRHGVELSNGDIMLEINKPDSPTVISGFIKLDAHLNYLSFYPGPIEDWQFLYWVESNAKLQKNDMNGAFMISYDTADFAAASWPYPIILTNFDSLYNGLPVSISGNIQYDHNSNCVDDAGDVPVSSSVVTLNDLVTGDLYYAVADSYGNYTGNVIAGSNYSIQHSPTYSSLNPLCPASGGYMISTGSMGIWEDNDFHDTADITIPDMAVHIGPAAFVPGLSSSLYVYVQNLGMPQDTIFRIVLDPLVSFDSSSPVPTSITSDTLTYSLGSMAPLSSHPCHIYFTTSSTAILGDPVICMASIPLSSDIDPSNNTDTLQTTVASSYDPNDKTSNKPLYFNGNDELIYRVRFQNTGTYMAKNIVVVDTIDQHLDMSTFHFLGGSPQQPEISWHPGNELRFNFKNIDLPDSNSNEAASHGEFSYSIKPKSTCAAGDVIINTARIYFDYNSAVTTNTAINIIGVAPEGISSSMNDEAMLQLYPNPTTGMVTVICPESGTLTVSNAVGQVRSTTMISGRSVATSIDLSSLPAGVYLYQFVSANKGMKKTGKLVLVH